jgi:hypothetical protein
MQEMTASQARYAFADLHESAMRHTPTRIVRRRGGAAVLVSEEDFETMLRGFRFHPEVFFEGSSVSIWLPELKIWGRGSQFEDAQTDLLDEIDQLTALLDGDSLMRAAPEIVERLPWIFRLAKTKEDAQRLELLFEEPVSDATHEVARTAVGV